MAGRRCVKCYYTNCNHKGIIDKQTEEYVTIGDGNSKKTYHKDCYDSVCDLALIRQLWHDHINNTIVYQRLNKAINAIIENTDVSTKQILFTLQYVIEHGMKLSYPEGLKYYIDNAEIKKAFADKETNAKLAEMKKESSQKPLKRTVGQTINYKPKKTGFSSIFGGNK